MRAIQPKGSSLIRRDPDVLEVKQGGGCLALFGVPFLLAGLFLILSPLGLGFVQTEEGGTSSLVMLLVGVPFTIVGAGLVLGRAGVVIDRRRGTAVKWWGLLAPMKQTEYRLNTFHHVSLNLQRGDSDSPDTYPVRLEDAAGQITVQVVQPTDYLEARRTAEEVAALLGRSIEDSSSGQKIVREVDRLDESLRERVKRTREDIGSLPPQPPTMKTRITETGDGIIAEIPAPSRGLIRLLPAVFGVGFIAFVAVNIIDGVAEAPVPPAVKQGILIFLALAVFMVVLGALRYARKASGNLTRITATRAALRIEEVTRGKSAVTEIPLDELEDLFLTTSRSVLESQTMPGKKKGGAAPSIGDTGTPRLPDGRPVPKILLALARFAGSPGVTARSDKAVVTFGKGLPEEEAAYLYALIKKTLFGTS